MTLQCVKTSAGLQGEHSEAATLSRGAASKSRVCTEQPLLSSYQVDTNMGSNNAASRISVLARQLSGMSFDESSDLSRQLTRANDDVRPAPGGGKGTLTILDNRTGKKYTVGLICQIMLTEGISP